jgi:hypothetical protein
MAIRTFNSVGGFSVGENPTNVILANGDITTGNATFDANVSAGNVKTDHYLYANGVAVNFQQPGGSNTWIQFNNQGNLGGSANFAFNSATNLLTLAGNANIGNVNVTGIINSAGNVTAPYFLGNVIGNISGNIAITGTLKGVVFNDGGNANSSSAFTFDKVTNLVTMTGNLTAGNVVSANYFTGTLTTAAQPNITSLGDLTGLTVTGNASVGNIMTAGNLIVTNKVISSLVPSADNTYDLGASTTTFRWRDLFVANSVSIGSTSYIRAIGNIIQTDAANIANNISAGSLTVRGTATLQSDLNISGNLTVSGATTYVNVTNTSIKDPIVDLGGASSGANSIAYDGKDRGLLLHNNYSANDAVVNQFIGWDSSNSEFALGSNVTLSSEVVTYNSFGNIRLDTVIGNLSGYVSANQYQVTKVGTLGNLDVTANFTTGNANITSTLKASGLTYPGSDGTGGQVIATYGNGVLYFATVSTTSITNGTSNVSVLNNGNINLTAAGNTTLVVTDTGANVAGTLNVTGNSVLKNTQVANLTLQSFYPNNVASANVTTVKSATSTTTSIAASQTIAGPISPTGIRGIEFIVKGEDVTGGKYGVYTVSAVHNGSSVDYAVYGTVNLGGSPGSIGVTWVSGGAGNIYLVTTPASTNSTVWTAQYRVI